MRTTAIVYRATMTLLACFVCLGASYDEALTKVTWGPISNGLQCGLATMGSQGGVYNLLLLFKNVGGGSIHFRDGDLRIASRALNTTDPSGRKSHPWSEMDAADPSLILIVEPGKYTGQRLFAPATAVLGSSATYRGSVTPIGATSSVQLRCGPITL